ncbi:hypothetical protein RHMOL_Rhmol05G0209700 [Rhododendron molle]|uniref:Uncharacterized protein n=1 Tax=Rhododendron molle TaxID=49168 RepID=A0ACC0NRI9_RHOML|nr:hypothetical protein RHMOL_Rhmol05G0209700 [Rhododendron molle]
MEEIQPINRWIQIEVEGVVYDAKVSENSTFVSPDEVEASVDTCIQKLSPMEDAMEVVSKAGKEDDDDVERPVEKVTNRNEVVGEGRVSSAMGAAMQGKDKNCVGLRGTKHVNAKEHLMSEKANTPTMSGEFESRVEDSVGSVEGEDVELGFVAHSEALSEAQEGEVGLDGSSNSQGGGPNNLLVQVTLDSRVPATILPQLFEPGIEGDALLGEENLMVRLSQIPSINLIVDLNNAECRRKEKKTLV